MDAEKRRDFFFIYKRMTAGNQHSENDNERKKLRLKQKTNKNKKKNVKTVPCTGSVSKQCILVYNGRSLRKLL